MTLDGSLSAVLPSQVGGRIAQVASQDDPRSGLRGGGQSLSHMRNLQWDYIVVQSPIPNAMVVPGGKVRLGTV